MIGARKTRLAFVLATLLAVLGSAVPGRAQEGDPKGTSFIEVAPKGGLNERDRELAADYLAEHAGGFPDAPSELAYQVRSLRQWTPECAYHAQRVPRDLRGRLSVVADGTFRVIFDRALLVISTNTGRVIDRVEPQR